jgi:CBS domain-containing protein
MPIGEICSREVVCAKRDATVKTAARLMRELMQLKGVRRLVVTDSAGYLVGIVSADDVLCLLAEEMSAVASMVAGERNREAALRKVMA